MTGTFKVPLLLGSPRFVHRISVDQISTNDEETRLGMHRVYFIDQRRQKLDLSLPSTGLGPPSFVQSLAKN